MFDPIKTPSDSYRGPAQGESTEHGDSWKVAMEKVNAGFKNVVGAIEGGAGGIVEVVDGEARALIAALEETLTTVQKKLDELVVRVAALSVSPHQDVSEPVAAEPEFTHSNVAAEIPSATFTTAPLIGHTAADVVSE